MWGLWNGHWSPMRPRFELKLIIPSVLMRNSYCKAFFASSYDCLWKNTVRHINFWKRYYELNKDENITYNPFIPTQLFYPNLCEKKPLENQKKGTNLNFGLLLPYYCVEHPVSSSIMIDMHRVYVFKVILLSLCHWKLNNWNVFYENKCTFSNIQVLKVWNLFKL